MSENHADVDDESSEALMAVEKRSENGDMHEEIKVAEVEKLQKPTWFALCCNCLETDENGNPSNESLLSTAFVSFLAFTVCQLFGAFFAESEAMMADTAAMMVDALTYGFNLYAERQKAHASAVERLKWELVPPLLSVTTLIGVNLFVTREALKTLVNPVLPEDEPKLWIMVSFSTANLVLDVINVSCFARANRLFGFQTEVDGRGDARFVQLDDRNHDEEDWDVDGGTDQTPIIKNKNRDYEDDDCNSHESTNLNMCSAYTHVFADTLRSLAVILASVVAYGFHTIRPDQADAVAALAVSFLILLSLIPLVHGLCKTYGEFQNARAQLAAQREFEIITKQQHRSQNESNS